MSSGVKAMSKINLNKTELKKQQDTLQSYQKSLPLLELKKKQLQSEERKLEKEFVKKSSVLRKSSGRLKECSRLLAQINLDKFIEAPKLKIDTVNFCGIKIVKLKKINISVSSYLIDETPFWLESLLETVQENLRQKIEHSYLKSELAAISNELVKISQRVNLYSKVLIPKAETNIKEIKIYLDDQQTAAVVRGKKCKNLSKRRQK